MNKDLQKALNNLTEVEYRQLNLRMNVAKWIRSVMETYQLTDAQMAKGLSLTPTKFKHYKMGAVDYDMRFMAILQAKEMELGQERLKEQVEKRIVIPK